MSRKPFLLLALVSLTACSEPGTTSSDATEVVLTKEEHMQALFQSLLDGVQLIEAHDAIAKTSGPLDGATEPPRYDVTFGGCMDGFVAGAFCVEDGKHQVEVVTPEVHIIREVEQTYALEAFASVPDYVMSGRLLSLIEVVVDTTQHTTDVDGLASGELEVRGGIRGSVGVELEIDGGRNYTESTATPIFVTGTFTHEGERFIVEGGFQRE